MVGHGGIVGFEELTDMRAVAKHLLHFGAAESCGKCFPCRIGLQRAHAMFAGQDPIDREKLEALLETLELGSLCAHGGGMPAPIRSPHAHFPEELGLAITLTIDGEEVTVPPGTTILEAAQQPIPTLCFDERQAPFGACRVCLVGIEGAPGPVASCTTQVREGMKVHMRDPTARRVATAVVELVLSELPEPPAEHTELAQVARMLEVEEPRWPGIQRKHAHDERHPYLAFQHELCISCGRCVRACDEVQGTFALTAVGRGFDQGFRESACVACGACADTCPTDAITEISLLHLAR